MMQVLQWVLPALGAAGVALGQIDPATMPECSVSLDIRNTGLKLHRIGPGYGFESDTHGVLAACLLTALSPHLIDQVSG